MIRKLLESLHFSGAILALVTVLLVLSMDVHFEHNLEYSFFIFFSILAIYGIHRLIKFYLNNLNAKHYYWIRSVKNVYIIFTFISFIIALYLFFEFWYFDKNDLLIYSALILTCLYIIPYNRFSIRQIPRFKAIVISLVWSILIYYWPMISMANVLLFFAYFFYYLHLSIVSDIKDLKIDPFRLKTTPMEWGVLKTYIFSFLFLTVSFVLFLMHLKSSITIGFFLIHVILLLFLHFSKKGLHRFYDYSMFVLALHNFLLWE